jgi:hypothetical protein
MAAENSNSPDVKMPDQPNAAGNAPAAAGMMTPQAPEGDIESAKLDAYHAMRMLDRLISKMGRKNEYSEAALRARSILAGQFGEHEEDSQKFSDAEIKRMVLTLAGPGQQVPKQGATPPPGGGQQPPQGQQPPGGGQPPMPGQ